MKVSGALLWPAGFALCGLVLARSKPTVVYAPWADAPRGEELPRTVVPSDRYLDLGAAPSFGEHVPVYRSPLHPWQSELTATVPVHDETRYLDLGALYHSPATPSEGREP